MLEFKNEIDKIVAKASMKNITESDGPAQIISFKAGSFNRCLQFVISALKSMIKKLNMK